MSEKNFEELSDLTSLDQMQGAFVESLKRSNRKIKEDRAIAIAEGAELIYRREIEDLKIQIRDLVRDREGMLDLSPTNADSLVLASDFNAKEFVNKDITSTLKLRDLYIKLEVAQSRYNKLFSAKIEPAPANTGDKSE